MTDKDFYAEVRSVTNTHGNPELRELALERLAADLTSQDMLTLLTSYMSLHDVDTTVDEIVTICNSSYEVVAGAGPLRAGSPEFEAEARECLQGYLERYDAPEDMREETDIQMLMCHVHDLCDVALYYDTRKLDIGAIMKSLLTSATESTKDK